MRNRNIVSLTWEVIILGILKAFKKKSMCSHSKDAVNLKSSFDDAK
jgi:hypothetical protein